MAYLDRLGLLTGWRDSARAEGLQVPAYSELQLIAEASDGVWPAEVSDFSTHVWGETIVFLLRQQAAGIHNPIATLPSRLAFPPGSAGQQTPSAPQVPPSPQGRPTGDAGPAVGHGPDAAAQPTATYGPPSWYRPPEVDEPASAAPTAGSAPEDTASAALENALLAWKRTEERRGTKEVDKVKDNELLGFARQPPSSIDMLRSRLSNDAKQFAAAIAAILGLTSPAEAAPAVADVHPPSTASFAAGLVSGSSPVPGGSPAGVGGSADRPDPAPGRFPQPSDSVPVGDSDGPTVENGIDLEMFAPYDLNQFEVDPAPVGDIRVTTVDHGHRLMVWKPTTAEGAVVVYRVVSRDDYPPVHVDDGELLAAVYGQSAIDVHAPTSAVRHYQVWANVGRTMQDAQWAQPVLVAESAVVSQVSGVNIREENGTVVGEWQSWREFEPRTTSVQIYRIPAAAAKARGIAPQFRILADDENLNGFVDRAAERGRSFVYAIVAVAQMDSSVDFDADGLPETVTKTSTPWRVSIKVSAPLDPVTDLEVILHDDLENPSFDVYWTAPSAGTVRIFRTASGPAPGLEQQGIIDAAALDTGVLVSAASLSYPVDPVPDGRVGMRQVPWPADADRIFFTPVTFLQGKAVLGPTAVRVRVPPVLDVKLVERVDEEVLHFPWPRGASHVHAYVGTEGTQSTGGSTWAQEMSRDEWERQGGMHIRPHLPSRGCHVHLFSAAYSNGQKIYGTAATVLYRSLLRLYYDVSIKKNLLGQPVAARLSIRALEQTDVMLSFSVIHNPLRLPLQLMDGVPLLVSRVDDETHETLPHMTVANLSPETANEQWQVNLRPPGLPRIAGYFRVFAQLDTEALNRIALIDPPIRRLMIGEDR